MAIEACAAWPGCRAPEHFQRRGRGEYSRSYQWSQFLKTSCLGQNRYSGSLDTSPKNKNCLLKETTYSARWHRRIWSIWPPRSLETARVDLFPIMQTYEDPRMVTTIDNGRIEIAFGDLTLICSLTGVRLRMLTSLRVLNYTKVERKKRRPLTPKSRWTG